MKKLEILELREKHPNLFQRALRLERQALTGKHKLRSTKGLGRNFAWSDLEKQLDLWSSTTPERRSGNKPQIWHAPPLIPLYDEIEPAPKPKGQNDLWVPSGSGRRP